MSPAAQSLSNYQELYQELGPGYGIIQAMKSVAMQMEEMQANPAAADETRNALQRKDLLQKLASFYTDERWQQVIAAKKSQDLDTARKLALEIQKTHGLPKKPGSV